MAFIIILILLSILHILFGELDWIDEKNRYETRGEKIIKGILGYIVIFWCIYSFTKPDSVFLNRLFH